MVIQLDPKLDYMRAHEVDQKVYFSSQPEHSLSQTKRCSFHLDQNC